MSKSVTFTFSPDDGPAQEIEATDVSDGQEQMLRRFADGQYPDSFITLDYRIDGGPVRRGIFRGHRISNVRGADA